MCDAAGRAIYSQSADATQTNARVHLDLGHLLPGIYFVEAANKTGSETKRVVVR